MPVVTGAEPELWLLFGSTAVDESLMTHCGAGPNLLSRESAIERGDTMNASKSIRITGLLAAAALLASCAGLARQDAAQAARYNAYAGQPVDHFTWMIQHRGWTAISSNQLIAWSDANKPYLITVAQPCPNLWMNANGITSTLDEVHARTNYVLAAGRHCVIESIQPIDYQRMQRDLQQRQAAAEQKTRDSSVRD